MPDTSTCSRGAGRLAAPAPRAPELSLLIPIYNVERYLSESLASACAQSLADIEIICIDDGSTDGSAAIIDEFARRDGRIRVISKANSGYGDSMNRGLAAARGAYVGILEPDDILYPDGLRLLYDAARRADADVAKGNFDLYWSQPRERIAFSEVIDAARCASAVCPRTDPFIFYEQPSIWSAVYRRSFLDQAGVRFLPTPGASFQDCSFAFKALASAQRVAYVHDAVLRYRQDNEGSSVHASDKVFCVCDEYAEIERWIEEDFGRRCGQGEAARLRRIAQIAKYDSYLWSYVRLAPEYREMFLTRMAREFSRAIGQGWFSLGDLKPWKRANLEAIMRDPAHWARRNAAYAEAGPAGRAWHYLRLGGPGLLISYVRDRLHHE